MVFWVSYFRVAFEVFGFVSGALLGWGLVVGLGFTPVASCDVG